MLAPLLAITCAAPLAVVVAGCASRTDSPQNSSHGPFAFSRTVAAPRPQSQPSEHGERSVDSDAALFAELDSAFGRNGEVKDGVYRLVTPRPDLFVTVNGMDVPTGAFLESDFRFWRCPCGKALVNGQFVVADYEANDVINELQLGHLEIASLAPLLLNEHPRLLLVRFQGEGDGRQLAKTLKSALSYTGEARSKPAPANLAPQPD
jgi:hypothetical protein